MSRENFYQKQIFPHDDSAAIEIENIKDKLKALIKKWELDIYGKANMDNAGYLEGYKKACENHVEELKGVVE